MIIPRKGLAELKRLVDEEDADQVEIGFEGNSGLARKNSVTLVMRLIEGKFPNYQQVIPANADQKLTLASKPVIRAIRRVALLSVERSHAVKLELSKGLLRLSSSNPDLGQAQEELDAIYGPVGLDIGAETPAEMAVSILAEVVQARYGAGSGLSLRGESGRVHKQRGVEEGTA